jgi:two-component system C4-dicarboxylate transport response regulator DctD
MGSAKAAHGDVKGSAVARPLIYLIDDDEHVLRSLKLALMRKYDVRTHNEPVGAVFEVRALRPNVVVLDLKMPGHDGFWVFQEIRKFDAHVPIIFNSAYQDSLPAEDVMGAYGPFGYISKGDGLGGFLDMVARAVQAAPAR